MVATAVSVNTVSHLDDEDEELLELTGREKVLQRLQPVLRRLKNRWVILGAFLIAYVPFSMNFATAYQDFSTLDTQITNQRSVLALPEPRTDDIAIGLASWEAALESATEQQVIQLPASTLLERVVAAAVNVGVSVRRAGTLNDTQIPVGDEMYWATPIVLMAEGSFRDITNFIAALEGNAVGAFEVQNSLISKSGGTFVVSLRATVFNRPVPPYELIEEDEDPRRPRSNRLTTGPVDDDELSGASQGDGK